MKVTRLAWRNLWRRKRRTLITGFSIAFGVLLAVTFTGTGDYAYTNMINAGASMGLGHVTIEPSGYNQVPSLDKRLRQSSIVREKVKKVVGVENAFTRIIGQAMFASANKTVGGAFIAINPEQEVQANNLFMRSIVKGKMFDKANGNGVVVGSIIARNLKLGIGKKIVYTTTDARGEIVSAMARVTGIYQTGVKEVDGSIIVLPIVTVRTYLAYGPDDASLIAVVVRDQRYSEKIRDSIQLLVGNDEREVLSWKQTQADLAGIITMDRSGNYISQVLVGLLIAAGILNTLLMSVLERTREFGVMMALGMTPATLFRLIIVESVWLAIVGIVFGILITSPWYAYLYYVGIDFSEAMGTDYSAGGVLVDPVFKIRLYKESVIAIIAGVFSLTLASGLYPAWRAGRIPPVESLKAL